MNSKNRKLVGLGVHKIATVSGKNKELVGLKAKREHICGRKRMRA
jgi:hypothetical protein